MKRPLLQICSQYRHLRLIVTVLCALSLGWLSIVATATSHATTERNNTVPPAQSPPTVHNPVFLPLIQGVSAPEEVPPALLPAREWDVRLDQRGTVVKEASPVAGSGYWRLVRAVWYDEKESQGRHHIFVDLLDAEGKRMVGVPIKIYWSGGSSIVHTQAKPGEAYAADFGMFDVAPSYGAVPADGHPADDVWGMGMGSIEQPKYKIHSSYGLVWQWTVTDKPTP